MSADAQLTDDERESLAYAALLDVNDDVMVGLSAMVEAILRDQLPEATTVTEWRVRNIDPDSIAHGRVYPQMNEENARLLGTGRKLIPESRTVTRYADHYGPWEQVTK